MYASYNLTPTLNAKVGRLRTPFYMFSEYLEVGYTYHWIRPPVELYAAQVTNMDGVSFLYNLPIGSIDSQYMVSIGNREGFSDDPNASVSNYKPLVAANAQFEFEHYTVKLIYTQGDISFVATDITAAGAGFNDASFVAENVNVEDSTVIFAGAGIDINFHPIKVLLEYSNIDFDDLLLADGADGIKNTADDVYLSNQALAGSILGTTDRDVTTHTFGMRHDFHDSAAFKVELISTEDADLDTEATLLRFGVDMLF